MVSRFRRHAGTAFAGLVLLYLYAPIAVIVLFSFTSSPRLAFPIEGFTLGWYANALSNPLMTTALRNSVLLALVSAVVAGGLGAAFAFGLVKLQAGRVRQTLLAGSLLPAVVPLLVIGVSLAVFFRGIGQSPGLVNAAIGHAVVCLPFVILTMNARLETFDFSILEAARDLGASPARAFRDVTLPMIRPSLVGAALLAAALSLDEFVVTWFNIGNDLSVPVLVWGLLRRGVDPTINAIAVMLLAALVILVLASNLVGRRRAR
jgi:spermidine/putrescine transport system permease protein